MNIYIDETFDLIKEIKSVYSPFNFNKNNKMFAHESNSKI